ncbi:MAG: hypothetical protein QXR89_07955 [Candidatus Bathyarchaeia archaeon]
MKTKSKVALAALILASIIGISMAVQYLNWEVGNRVEVIGYLMVKVYKDEACTEPLTYIDWGTAYRGAQLEYCAYIKNEGEIPAYVTWSVSGLPSCLQLSIYDWSQNMVKLLNPGNRLMIRFMLTVASDAPYQTFTFTITFTATDTYP